MSNKLGLVITKTLPSENDFLNNGLGNLFSLNVAGVEKVRTSNRPTIRSPLGGRKVLNWLSLLGLTIYLC